MMIQNLCQNIIKQFHSITGVQCSYGLFNKGEEPHFTTLTKKEQGVYVFYHDRTCFKVGKAGANSQARWNSHHYNLDVGTRSSMTKSIIKNLGLFKSFYGDTLTNEIQHLDSSNIKQWIKQNVSRIEFNIDSQESKFTLALLESLVQFYFRPVYEGKVTTISNIKFK